MSRLKELRAYVNGELEKMENPDKRLGAVNHLYGVQRSAGWTRNWLRWPL